MLKGLLLAQEPLLVVLNGSYQMLGIKLKSVDSVLSFQPHLIFFVCLFLSPRCAMGVIHWSAG